MYELQMHPVEVMRADHRNDGCYHVLLMGDRVNERLMGPRWTTVDGLRLMPFLFVMIDIYIIMIDRIKNGIVPYICRFYIH